MRRPEPIADIAPRPALPFELMDFGADGEDLFLLRFSAPPDVAELLPLLDGQCRFRAGKPFVQCEMSDGKAELIVFVAAEIDIELLNVFGFAVALHIAFRGAKCTLHL